MLMLNIYREKTIDIDNYPDEKFRNIIQGNISMIVEKSIKKKVESLDKTPFRELVIQTLNEVPVDNMNIEFIYERSGAVSFKIKIPASLLPKTDYVKELTGREYLLQDLVIDVDGFKMIDENLSEYHVDPILHLYGNCARKVFKELRDYNIQFDVYKFLPLYSVLFEWLHMLAWAEYLYYKNNNWLSKQEDEIKTLRKKLDKYKEQLEKTYKLPINYQTVVQNYDRI